LEEYELKNENLISNRGKYLKRKATTFYNNPICQNLIHIYKQIELPTEEQIWIKGRELAKERKKTKKGKTITMRNKHGNSHWKDYKNRSFVEDNIKLYLNLTKNGLKIWIRNLCKINGELIEEVDYSTLHPNIAIKIYGGSGVNINHTDVANYLGIDRKVAKIEHLSFFNKHWKQMKKSPLFEYYIKKEPVMMKNIKRDKYNSKYRYKVVSRRLFKMEVDIMTKVIEELNAMNIYVIYVYDALCCEAKNKEIVKSVMNKVVKEFNVNTTAE